MIVQLNGHISNHNIESIKNVIKAQYQKYLTLVNSPQFKQLFLEEYAPHKKQHSVSWAISSGFPSGSVVDGVLQVGCLRYGKGHTRPELKNERIVLHVLNKTTHFDADYLKDYYAMNDNGFQNEQLYCFVKFSVNNRRLQSVELCLPDKDGNIIEKETLIGLPELKLMVA